MPGRLIIVSEAFLNALTDAERSAFEARPVRRADKNRRQFFELVPGSFVPLGAIRGVEVGGWRCERCGRRVYGHGAVLGWGIEVACRNDLPADSPGFLFGGDPTDVHLFCTRARWQGLVGKKWSRRMCGQPPAVVDSSEFDADPLLGTLDEIAQFRRQHGLKVKFKPQPRS